MCYWKIDIYTEKISLDIYMENRTLALETMKILADIYTMCDKNTKRKIIPSYIKLNGKEIHIIDNTRNHISPYLFNFASNKIQSDIYKDNIYSYMNIVNISELD